MHHKDHAHGMIFNPTINRVNPRVARMNSLINMQLHNMRVKFKEKIIRSYSRREIV